VQAAQVEASGVNVRTPGGFRTPEKFYSQAGRGMEL